MFKHSLIFLLLFIICFSCKAQNQDCNNAIQVCSSNFLQSNAVAGFGAIQELNYPYNTSCLAAGEQNGVWYNFTVSTAGTLDFLITPNNIYDDYDWAVFDITNVGCNGIQNGTATEVVCNYSVFPGNTGMDASGTATTAGPLDPNISAPANMQQNHTYAMLVNNANHTANGYAVTFGGTAGIIDNTVAVPTDIAHYTCDQRDTLLVTLSEFVQCNSIAANGSDFSFKSNSQTYYIYAAYGVNCNVVSSTNQVQIIIYPQINFNGNYILKINQGTDGNSILDICGNQTPIGTSINYKVTNIPEVFLGNDTVLCDGDILSLDAGNTGLGYLWNDGSNSQILNIEKVPADISVKVDRNGCYAIDEIKIASACTVYAPNVFSPNGDGVNDVFKIISGYIADMETTIYDRWGTMIFDASTLSKYWDGFNKFGLACNLGTYVYTLNGHYTNGKEFFKTGSVALIR